MKKGRDEKPTVSQCKRMKVPLLSIVIVLVIWVVGIVIVFNVLSYQDDGSLRGSKWFHLMNTLTADTFHLRKKAATLMPHQLPHVSDHSGGTYAEDGRARVYLMWPHDDRQFGIHNYLALESALAIYPHAIFTALVLSSSDIARYKLPGVLAANKFAKYRLQGHDLAVAPFLLKNHHFYKLKGISKDNSYIVKWIGSCCERRPYHLWMYLGLLTLWRTGGLLSDFSFYMLDALGIDNGYYTNSYCLSHEDQKVYRPRSYDAWGAAASLTCTTSSLLVAKHKHSPVIECMLNKYHSDEVFLTCIEGDAYEGAVCIQRAMAACYTSSGVSNDLTQEKALEAFGDDPMAAQAQLLSGNWTLMDSAKVLWMGTLSRTASLFPYPNGSLLYTAVVQTRALLNRSTSLLGDAGHGAGCHRFAPIISLPSHHRTLSSSSAMHGMGCSPSIYLINTPALSGTNILTPTCGDYTAGMPEAQTQTQTQTLTLTHNSIAMREDCYPYTEAEDKMLIVDSGSYRPMDPYLPYVIQQDNPSAKVILTLQHPVLALYLSYTSLSPSLSFDEVLLQVLGDPLSPPCVLRTLLTTSLSNTTDEVLSSYYAYSRANSSTYNSSTSSAEHMLMTAMAYALAPLHYRRVLGDSRVLVVTDGQSDEVMRFLSLPPPRRWPHMVPIAPRSVGMSQDMYCKLLTFFAPFTSLLTNISTNGVHANLTSWDHPASGTSLALLYGSLPVYSPRNNNTSWPLLWFEVEDEESNADRIKGGGLSGRLVPQRLSSEDSSFNTTLGMLNTF